MTPTNVKEGRLVIALDPAVLPVSQAVSYLSKETELTDVSVSGASAEEMVAALYKEFRI